MISKYKLHQLGHSAESASCQYLKRQGLQFIQSNFRCRFGEIDLIMQEGEVFVFIEVRMRSDPLSNNQILESVTSKKQNRIIRTALFYLQSNELFYSAPCRFDVVAVQLKEGQYKFQWLKGAFDANVNGY